MCKLFYIYFVCNFYFTYIALKLISMEVKITPTSFYLSEEEKDKMDRIALKEIGAKNRNGLLRKWINLYEL